MFTADFGYAQLLKWMAQPEVKIGILTRDVKTITNLIVHDTPKCSISRTTGIITLPNKTQIYFHLIEDGHLESSVCRMRGGRWHYVWGHQTPKMMQEVAKGGTELGDYPIALFTE